MGQLYNLDDIPSERAYKDRTDSPDSGISDQKFVSEGTDMDGEDTSDSDGLICECALKIPDDTPRMAEIKATAFQLAYDIVQYISQCSCLQSQNSHTKTLRRVVDQISERHQIVFSGIFKKLNVQNIDEARHSFVSVVGELFSDKQINWGRIVTTYAFAGSMAKYGFETKLGNEFVEMIGEETGKYISTHLSHWILQHGGWDSMDEFFFEEEPVETKMWKSLLYTVVGLGALVTTVVVIR